MSFFGKASKDLKKTRDSFTQPMRCPICGNEMEPGFLQQNGPVASWTKKIHEISLLPGAGEILLERKVFSSVSFKADICKRCKKIVVDYSDKKIKEK